MSGHRFGCWSLNKHHTRIDLYTSLFHEGKLFSCNKKKREMGKGVELGGIGKGLRVNKIKIYCSMNEILKELIKMPHL